VVTGFGGGSWSRTNIVYHGGTDLQSAAEHAISTMPPYVNTLPVPERGSRTHFIEVYHDFFGRASNVFAYGRGTENRTLINRLKAYYFSR